MKNRMAFTLVELVIVIVVLGVLAGAFMPKAVNILADAKDSANNAEIASVQEALRLEYSYNFSRQ